MHLIYLSSLIFSSFKQFLEHQPQLREILHKFYGSKYAKCFELLEHMKVCDLYHRNRFDNTLNINHIVHAGQGGGTIISSSQAQVSSSKKYFENYEVSLSMFYCEFSVAYRLFSVAYRMSVSIIVSKTCCNFLKYLHTFC